MAPIIINGNRFDPLNTPELKTDSEPTTLHVLVQVRGQLQNDDAAILQERGLVLQKLVTTSSDGDIWLCHRVSREVETLDLPQTGPFLIIFAYLPKFKIQPELMNDGIVTRSCTLTAILSSM